MSIPNRPWRVHRTGQHTRTYASAGKAALDLFNGPHPAQLTYEAWPSVYVIASRANSETLEVRAWGDRGQRDVVPFVSYLSRHLSYPVRAGEHSPS